MHATAPLIDLVPGRTRTYFGLAMAAVLIVAGLEYLYAVMPLLAPHTTDGGVAAFDLDAEGSLAAWVSSMTLEVAAVAALIVYVLQTSLTPKRGGRLWLWAAACWTVMSIDESSSLHEAFKELMSHATGRRLIHDGTIWWVGAYFLVLSVTGLLLLARMRTCRAASIAFLAVAGFYATAVLCELGLLLPKDRTGVMVEEGCEMLGNFCLLGAMLLFARHKAEHFRTPAIHEFVTPGEPRAQARATCIKSSASPLAAARTS